jgi:arylsulfatase A-like enzyme
MTNCPLSEERAHVPLIVKTDGLPFLQRCSALTQHSDLPATLCDWFGLDELEESNAGFSLLPMIRGEQESIREFGVSLADDWRAIRDSNWLLIENRNEGIERLYRQPEDRRQILDVFPHYVEVADWLGQQLRT